MARALPLLLLGLLAAATVGLQVVVVDNPLLVVGGLGGVLFLYLVLTRSRWALYLLAGTFPFVTLQVLQRRGLSLSLADLSSLTYCAGTLLLMLFGRGPKLQTRYLVPLGLFWGVCGLSLIVSTNLGNSLAFLGRFTLALVTYALLVSELQHEEDVRRFALAFLAGMAVLILANAADYRALSLPGLHRVAAGSGNPNVLGDLIGVALVLALYFCVERPARVLRPVVWYVAFGLLFFALLFTYSRWGWVSFAVALLFWMVVNRISLKWISLLAIAGVLIALFDESLASILMRRGWVDQSTQNRLATYSAGLRSMAAHPLLGIGFDQFDSLYRYMWLPEGAYKRAPHNLYIKVGVEVGVVGLILFLGTMYRMVVGLLQRVLRAELAPRERLFYGTLSAATVQQAVSQLSKSGMTSPTFWMVLAFATAMALRLEQRQRARGPEPPGPLTEAGPVGEGVALPPGPGTLPRPVAEVVSSGR